MDEPNPADVRQVKEELLRRREERKAKRARQERIDAAQARVDQLESQVTVAARRHRSAARRMFKLEDRCRRAIRRLGDLSSEEGSLIV